MFIKQQKLLEKEGVYRSVDDGKTFQVITSNTKNSIIRQGKQGRFETNPMD